MSRDQELLERWRREEEIYRAWGDYVISKVIGRIQRQRPGLDTSLFFKIPPSARLKDGIKLVEKAFYRNKPYVDAYSEITDKVGTRFVVLLQRDIKAVAECIESEHIWETSRDRDFEREQTENPIVFDYSAVHFVVRPKADITLTGGLIIPAGVPCEVQIKTLLQHAYSELTHDTVYKPKIEATPRMRRNAAKSMALLEATNDYFERLLDDVDEILKTSKAMSDRMSRLFRELVGVEPKPTVLEGMLLDAYEASAEPDLEDRIRALIQQKPYLREKIRDRMSQGNPIYFQPSLLLVYDLILNKPSFAKNSWPLTPQEMEYVLNDMGESLN